MTPEEAKRHARTAILVTCALYAVYGVTRALAPFDVGIVIVAGFYFLPMLVLRKQPELAERYQVGPDMPIPQLRWKGVKIGLLACAIVFPIFAFATFWFYSRICAGDYTLLAPALWAEAKTPFAGTLEHFLGAQCRSYHGEGLLPPQLRIPASWAKYFGGGFVYALAIEIFAIALPEEVFHRGYLMSALEERWKPKRKLAGVAFGWAAVLSSIMFAVGHMVGEAQTHRLATFFPALIFAWLWRRSESLWAPAIFHAGSNLLMQVLLASTFPPR